jgi:hypothetical protein
MLDFIFLKEVHIPISSTLKAHTQYFASTYQGGILLKTLTIYQGSVSENITSIPMAEIYDKEDGTKDIRMMNFALGQVGVDLGFDLTSGDEK